MSSYQVVRSKMAKTKVLQTDAWLSRFIPETKLFSKENLKTMLSKYSKVYVKPDCGRKGERVMAINFIPGEGYKIHYTDSAKTVADIPAVVKFVKEIAENDKFIVQRGIDMLCLNNVPFDLRVNVQKPYTKWIVSSMIAKKQAPGKIVTNYSQGGTLVAFTEALQLGGLGNAQINKLRKLLTNLGERTAIVLNEKYPGLRELGLDIALDKTTQKPWILEVNTKPQYPKGLSAEFDRYRRIIKRKYR
ncbi:MAG: YheC/YheD family protein [Firmicutes bacterium]|nr:YheC/YheD family protein [Bacillota bacterium]